MKVSVFASLVLLVLVPILSAQQNVTPVARARDSGIFTLYSENDYFGGTDRHYTNGAKLSWMSRDLRSDGSDGGWKRLLPLWGRSNAQFNFGFAVGQNIYTPEDTDAFVPDPLDRPYAGWTYGEISFVSKTERTLDTFSIQFGLVGPHSGADDTQRVVHDWLDVSRPNGWEYQLKDEWGVNLVYERNWRMYARGVGDHLGFDVVPHVGASLGNVLTYANAGATVRLGINLPSDFGVQLIRPGGTGNTPVDDLDPRVSDSRSWGVFIFGSADGRAVARDIFLDGNTWKDSPSVDKETWVADLAYGAGLVISKVQITFSQVYRTKEFKTQPDDHAVFGSISFSTSY